MRSKRLKLMVGAVLVAMIGTIFTGCGSDKTSKGENSSSVTISISGSTSVGPLMESIQEVYEEKNNNVILDTKFVEIYDALEEDIKSITGVIESGLFMEYPIEVIH